MKIAHMKDLRCLELEKQVNLHETQLANLHKENERFIDEHQTAVQDLKKENEQLNQLIRSITKSNPGMEGSSPRYLSNIDENDETNKFITSPNSSMARITEEGMGQEAADNPNNHLGITMPNECSFGDFERLGSILGGGT